MSSEVAKNAPEGYISGEYAVGTKCFTVVDTDRKYVTDDGRGERKISVRMYYPADKEAAVGHKYALLFSEPKKAALMKAYHIKNVSDDQNYAEYYEDVPVSGRGKFPLIMFSMGYRSYVESNTYLLCALASSGYIVASVGHAFEAIENDYEDGSTDELDKRIKKVMYTSTLGAILGQNSILGKKLSQEEALERFDTFQKKYTPFLIERVSEWKKDFDAALKAVRERFADNIDSGCGVGVSGHSLGGCTAYYLCRYGEEYSCGINIDGALFGDYPESTMKKPFCQISCRENINCETRPFFDTAADTYQVVFDDMKHLGFTDAKFFVPVKFIVGKLDAQEMFRHLAYCHITFFDKYLKGRDIAFDGLPSDKITYRKIH